MPPGIVMPDFCKPAWLKVVRKCQAKSKWVVLVAEPKKRNTTQFALPRSRLCHLIENHDRKPPCESSVAAIVVAAWVVITPWAIRSASTNGGKEDVAQLNPPSTCRSAR